MNGNGENIVCVIYPERQPEIAMLDECEKLIRGFGMHIRTWNIPGCSGYGLMYDDRKILKVGREQFLIGPVIMYAGNYKNDEIISLDQSEIEMLLKKLEDRTFNLWVDGMVVRAVKM